FRLSLRERLRDGLIGGGYNKLSKSWTRPSHEATARLATACTASAPRRRSAKTMACIEARGLRKAFGETVALDGIDLRVEEGRILRIIGPNSADKTTDLNANSCIP